MKERERKINKDINFNTTKIKQKQPKEWKEYYDDDYSIDEDRKYRKQAQTERIPFRKEKHDVNHNKPEKNNVSRFTQVLPKFPKKKNFRFRRASNSSDESSSSISRGKSITSSEQEMDYSNSDRSSSSSSDERRSYQLSISPLNDVEQITKGSSGIQNGRHRTKHRSQKRSTSYHRVASQKKQQRKSSIGRNNHAQQRDHAHGVQSAIPISMRPMLQNDLRKKQNKQNRERFAHSSRRSEARSPRGSPDDYDSNGEDDIIHSRNKKHERKNGRR
ncbi:MAG: hypothetical protein EZS28_011718 [Streblomastix strix]|uniref:Uncharacterized protein n=1 Tax=Streblomastix strix TaxID=222440 RepID=A0A5J4WCR8_9EUKA|nr:MAG: hypothetical protein EZS28_011718 [Streblomastix strix]